MNWSLEVITCLLQEVSQWNYGGESVQSLSRIWLFATLWITACQASLSITNSQSLLKLMSIKLVMPSNYLILCRPLLLLPSIFPTSGTFPTSQFFTSGGQSIGVSGSASVLPMNTQDWFPLGFGIHEGECQMAYWSVFKRWLEERS